VLALLVGIPFDNASGSLNKPLYLVIVVVGFVITAMFLRSSRARQLDKALAVVASIGLVWGIWTIERPALIAYFWEGFGARVGLGVVLLLGLLAVLLFGQVLPRWLRLGLGLVVAVCAVCDVLSLIRTFDFMPIVTNNVNEVNDVLGPAAGNAPSSTFIPQYTDLYGWWGR
jgi:hypothetical protein